MNEKPPFDMVRASFYLIAGVFATYALLLIAGVLVCAWNLDALIEAKHKCMKEGGFLEALSTLLASALAFAAGQTRSK